MLDCRKKKKKKRLVCILQKSPLVLVPAHKSLSEIAFLYKKLYFLQEDELMYGLEQQLFVAKLFSFVAKREGWLALGMFLILSLGMRIVFLHRLFLLRSTLLSRKAYMRCGILQKMKLKYILI